MVVPFSLRVDRYTHWPEKSIEERLSRQPAISGESSLVEGSGENLGPAVTRDPQENTAFDVVDVPYGVDSDLRSIERKSAVLMIPA